MRRLLFGVLGLVLGTMITSIVGACCPAAAKLQSGVYVPTDSAAEADYRFTIAPDLTTASETFSRNGVPWEINYSIGAIHH